MKNAKVIVLSIMAIGLLLSTAEARMPEQGKGKICDKMSKGSGSDMMGGMEKGKGMMGDMDMMHGHFMKKGLHFYFKNKEALGFTGDQLEQLHDIKVNFKKSYIMDKAKLKVAKIELEELLDADQVNMEVVKKKVKEVSGLKETLLFAKIKTGVDAKKILNEEQKKKAKKLNCQNKEKSEKSKGMAVKEGGDHKEHH